MKRFTLILLTAFMILSLFSCSSTRADKNSGFGDDSSATETVTPDTKPDTSKEEEKPDTKPEENQDVTPADVEAAIAKALGDGYFCTAYVPESELFLSNMAGIDLSQLDDYIAKQAVITAVYMDTVIVMKCKPGYADTAVDILNENYARTISYIRQYPFGVAKVEGARLYKIGDIVMFILAGDCAPSDATAEDEAKLAASEYEKIDKVIKDLFGSVPQNLAIIKEPESPDNGGEFDGGFEDSEDMPIIGG